jgi:hypothetical protein
VLVWLLLVVVEHTHKFEVIGNVKANGFKTTGGTASQF